ncbi:hypothetical protein ACFL6S_00745 [Candidatus Poribacteria bacterium]
MKVSVKEVVVLGLMAIIVVLAIGTFFYSASLEDVTEGIKIECASDCLIEEHFELNPQTTTIPEKECVRWEPVYRKYQECSESELYEASVMNETICRHKDYPQSIILSKWDEAFLKQVYSLESGFDCTIGSEDDLELLFETEMDFTDVPQKDENYQRKHIFVRESGCCATFEIHRRHPDCEYVETDEVIYNNCAEWKQSQQNPVECVGEDDALRCFSVLEPMEGIGE